MTDQPATSKEQGQGQVPPAQTKAPEIPTLQTPLNEGKIKKDKNDMYTTASIFPPHSFATTMLCRLFGKLDSTKFSPEWLPLIDAAVNTTVMNWAQILSDNLARTIMEYRRKRSVTSRVYPPFF